MPISTQIFKVNIIVVIAAAHCCAVSSARAGKYFKDLDASTSGTLIGKVKVSGPMISSITRVKKTSVVTAVWNAHGEASLTESSSDYEVIDAEVMRPSYSNFIQQLVKPIARPARIAAFYFGNLDVELGLSSIGGVFNSRRAIDDAAKIPGPTGVLQGRSFGHRTTDTGSATRLLAFNRIFGKGRDRVEELEGERKLKFSRPKLNQPGIGIERPGFPRAAKPRSFPRFFGKGRPRALVHAN